MGQLVGTKEFRGGYAEFTGPLVRGGDRRHETSVVAGLFLWHTSPERQKEGG